MATPQTRCSRYAEKAHELEEAGQFFMAAIALAFAIETAILMSGDV